MSNPWGLPSRDERPHVPKNKPLKDRDVLGAFAEAFPYCMACGSDKVPLHIHHILGGRAGRSDEWCNLLRLCFHPCHDLAEGKDIAFPQREIRPGVCDLLLRRLPKLPLAVQLTIKLLRDPENYDADRLAVLHGRTLPDHMPVPDYFLELYRRNRGGL